jgi:deoxyribonuclease IV
VAVRSPPLSGDLLGAHVSTQGGVDRAPARGVEIGATAIQVFTKGPNQWREPLLTQATVRAFRAALAQSRIRAVVSHDSYLINLASPDDRLRRNSMRCFKGELRRCRALGIPWVVSHPGNYIDDRAAGLERNARAYAACLAAVPGEVGVLIEGTAGSGTVLGATFEELRALRTAMPATTRRRVAFCLDTAHLHAAGYDVKHAIESVWQAFDREVGLRLLRCMHLNDSKAERGSRLDRHEWVGEGRIGPEAFRRIMRDRALSGVIKIIETPKGDDPVRHDRRMLRRLRAYARGAIDGRTTGLERGIRQHGLPLTLPQP